MTAATKTPEADVRDDAPELAHEGLLAHIPGWLRAVAVIGLVTAIALYWWGGLRWVLPWGPSWVGALAGFLVIWAACGAAVELLHRYHRHIARHSARTVMAGGLGVAAGSGAAWRSSGPLRERITRWAGRRWHERTGACDDDPSCRFCGDPDADAAREVADRAETARRFPDGGDALPDPDALAPGAYPTRGDAMITRDLDRPESPFPDDSYVAGQPNWHGGKSGGGSAVLALFRQLANMIAEAEPGTHEELLALMADGINGFGALARGYVGLYEHCRDSRKLSQASVGALEEVADAISDCMTTQAYARQKYAQAYEPAAEVAEQHGLPVGARQFFDPGEG